VVFGTKLTSYCPFPLYKIFGLIFVLMFPFTDIWSSNGILVVSSLSFL
jgi:hypothetical protein